MSDFIGVQTLIRLRTPSGKLDTYIKKVTEGLNPLEEKAVKLVNGFFVKGFFKKSEKVNPIVGYWKKPEKDFKEVRFSYAHVVYRHNPKDVFVLTSGAGLESIRKYAEGSFTFRVAQRLIRPKGIVYAGTAQLAGEKSTTVTSYRRRYDLTRSPLDQIFQVIENFKSVFKAGCSLFDKKYLNKEEETGVTVRLGTMRIHKAYTMTEWAKILTLFSLIAKRRRTKEKDDTAFDYLENIRRVTVNDRLGTALKAAAMRTNDLYLGHRNHLDFLGSGNFILRDKNKRVVGRWGYPPNLRQVMNVVRASGSDIEDMRISFWKHSNVPLLECFQGDIRIGEDRYFRVKGTWYSVATTHLGMVEKQFYELVGKSLKKPDPNARLKLPWFADKEWAAFTVEDAMKATGLDRGTVTSAIRELEGQKFKILACDHAVSALLKGTMRKKVADLTLLLKAKKIKEAKDLKGLFKKEKEYESAFKVLDEERKVCQPIASTFSRRTVLDVDGNVEDESLRGLKLPRGIETYRDEVEELLQSGEQVTLESLQAIITGGRVKRFVPNYLNFLQTEQRVSISRYLLCGPPQGVGNAQLRQFFQKKYGDFRAVLPEEGYNRLYLDVPEFLTGDQIMADNVELFDILRKSENHVHLFHVKKHFNQQTRDACAQVRDAAHVVRCARDGDTAPLKKMFKDIMTGSEKSAFRDAVRKKMREIAPTEKAFVEMFTEGAAKSIVFVYAFMDMGSKNRKLREEKDPSHIFDGSEFVVNNRSAFLKKLKKHGILSPKYQITDTFRRMTQKEFLKKGLSEVTFKVLKSYKSQFKSLIAKLELIHAARYVRGLGFGFRIWQIPRP